MNQTTRISTWTFHGNELYNDIADKAYLEGYVMADDADAAKHSTQDIMADGNKELVLRSLDKAATEAADLLHPYTAEDVDEDDLTADNTLPSDFHDYVFHVKLPVNFSVTTQNKAVALVHDYMVCKTLEDFLRTVNPGAAAKYTEINANLEAELHKTMNKRTRPTRIQPTQFP